MRNHPDKFSLVIQPLDECDKDGKRQWREQILVNDDVLNTKYCIDYDALVKSLTESGEFSILTCGCSVAECAGLYEGIHVKHDDDEVRWLITQPEPIRRYYFDIAKCRQAVNDALTGVKKFVKKGHGEIPFGPATFTGNDFYRWLAVANAAVRSEMKICPQDFMFWPIYNFQRLVSDLLHLDHKVSYRHWLILKRETDGLVQVAKSPRGYVVEWRQDFGSQRPHHGLAKAGYKIKRGALVYQSKAGLFKTYESELLSIGDVFELLHAFWHKQARPTKFLWRSLAVDLRKQQAGEDPKTLTETANCEPWTEISGRKMP